MGFGRRQRWFRELLSSKLCLERVDGGVESVLETSKLRDRRHCSTSGVVDDKTVSCSSLNSFGVVIMAA